MKSKMWRLLAGAALVANLCGPAYAQEETSHSPLNNEALRDIIVTARKTVESGQKAPATITVVDSETLITRGISKPQDLEKVLPSANMRSQGSAVVQTFIRGVGSNVDTANTTAGVAFVYNGIIVPRYGTAGLLFDIERVEVIAGPQGTLYGGSAAGGAINISSAVPKFDYSGSGLLEIGNYNQRKAAFSQNLPLSDKVALRAAVDYVRHDGYQSFDLDSQDRIAGRVSLLVQPSDDIKALFFASVTHETGNPITDTNNPFPYPDDPWRVPAVSPFDSSYKFPSDTVSQNANLYVVGANIEVKSGDSIFTYIPGFVLVKNEYRQVIGGGLPFHVINHEPQITQELRWNLTSGDFQVSAGAFYRHDKTDFSLVISIPFNFVPPVVPDVYFDVPTIIKDTRTSYASYAQVTYSASERLRLTAGGRISVDKLAATVTGGLAPFGFNIAIKDSTSHVDWKVGAAYDLTPSVLLYANVQTGYIPVSYSIAPTPPPAVSPSAPRIPMSKLNAYSGGIKSRFFNNRVELNAEAYYYDYHDFQAVALNTQTRTTTILPAKRARIYGVEATTRAITGPRGEIHVGVNLSSAKYTDFSGVDVLGIPYNYDGNQMIDAPNFNLVAGFKQGFAIGSNADLTFRADIHYEPGHYGTYTNNPFSRQDSYTKTDISVAYGPVNSRWSLQAFVDNVENAAVFGAMSAPAGNPGPGAGGLLPPRTYGVRLRANW